MATKIIEIEGTKYYTLLEGHNSDGTSPYVLLCHALMSNLHMWDRTVSILHAAGFATLRFDHVGHHNSTAPKDTHASFHMDDITRHMHQLVRETTGQQHVAALIGCSIGGVLALRYAMMFPEDVDAVVSVTAPGITAPAAAHGLWAERIQQFEKDEANSQDTLCRATVERWFPGGRQEDDAVRAEALALVKTCSLQGYRILADAIRNYDYAGETERLSAVRCLVVAGSEDTASTAEALRELSTKIQGARYVCIEQAGHLPPMQKPSVFNAEVLDFLRQQ